MIVKADLDVCRKGMEAYVGKRVKLKSSGGRKRTIVQEGILDSCYPNVFTVRCSKKNAYQEMISYSYIDILTRVVEIAIEPDLECRCEMVH
ncbi:MAG: Veg family protein [Clostridiaceae bacterium]|nr:Veg family protein [Clostridiaceae bacterium]